jgi:hypothetical protein
MHDKNIYTTSAFGKTTIIFYAYYKVYPQQAVSCTLFAFVRILMSIFYISHGLFQMLKADSSAK